MNTEAQLRSDLKRDRVIFRVTEVLARLVWGALMIWFAVIITGEAFQRGILLGILSLPFVVLILSASLLPSDDVQPFNDWRSSMDRRENEIDKRFGTKRV